VRAAILAVFLGMAALAQAAELDPSQHVRIEIDAPDRLFYVGEPIPLTLRVTADAAFLRDHLTQLGRQELDVPLDVVAPWVDNLPNARRVERPGMADDARTLALNGRRTQTTDVIIAVVDKTSLTAFEISGTYIVEAAGKLQLPAPAVRLAYASAFRDDFVNGRVPVDRTDVTIAGEPFVRDVRALPSEKRPSRFSGAVGRFALGLTTDARDVALGGTVRLTLTIEGDGNLTLFETPRLNLGDALHTLGAIDDRAWPRRTVTYDVSVLDAHATQLGPVEFPYFDPAEGGYRVARTGAIPLHVLPAEDPAPRADDAKSDAAPLSWWRHPPTLFAVLLALALVVGTLLRRRRGVETDDPADARLRAAASALCSATNSPESDLAGAFADYLAARLDCPAAAVIAPDLAERLTRAGVASDLSRDAAARLKQLVAAEYGGAPTTDAERDATLALFDRLEGAA